MCRLFGFRSVLESRVNTSLLHAENALITQGEQHPDGWGVAYYIAHSPHVIKSVASAVDDHLFRKVSGIVTSQTVLAHLRRSTIGALSPINTHPFQFGHWVFAHNGNIKNFSEHRMALLEKIQPGLQRFILGETDSELIFYLILSHLSEIADPLAPDLEYLTVKEAIQRTIETITLIVGPYHQRDSGPPEETYLTFIMTDGKLMIAHQGGKALQFSTYKNKCSERSTCPYLAPECEQDRQSGHVNHLIFSSEPLQGENIWSVMPVGTIVGVDSFMNIHLS